MNESNVLAVERRFFGSLVKPDPEDLDRLLSRDFSLIDLSGASLTKPLLLSVIGSGQLRFEAIEPLESFVRLYGRTAVVTGRTRMRGRFGEVLFTAESRYTHVFIDVDGEWRLVAAQGTPVQDAS